MGLLIGFAIFLTIILFVNVIYHIITQNTDRRYKTVKNQTKYNNNINRKSKRKKSKLYS